MDLASSAVARAVDTGFCTFVRAIDVAGGSNAPVWVETHVPADAAPGEYKGSVSVTVGGKPAATVPVALTVWPVTLPKTSAPV